MAMVNGDNTEIRNKISQRPKDKVDQTIGLISRMKGEMAKALPMHLKRNAERYARIAMTLIRENPFHVMTDEQVQAYGRKYSPSYFKKDSPWQTNPVAMGKKTVIRQLAKYMPLSPEMSYAIARDESVVSEGLEEIKEEKDVIDVMPVYPSADEESESEESPEAQGQEG